MGLQRPDRTRQGGYDSALSPSSGGQLAPISGWAVLAGLLVGLWSCLAPPPPGFPPPSHIPAPPPTAPTVPPRPPERIDTDHVLPWAVEEKVFLVVDKGCQLLRVYRYGRLVRSYPMVSARRDGRKLYEGDTRTPLGLYMIIDKRRHARWSYFMLLDYPSSFDVVRYRRHLNNGRIPRRNGSYPGPGGEIGIHGTSYSDLNTAGVNWTMGCISLLNPDIRELYRAIPEGTLVYIRE